MINIAHTRYSVVKEAAKSLGYRITKDDDKDWDIIWYDSAVTTEKYSKLEDFQRLNHYPGIYILARKNFLAINIMKMRKIYDKEFKFIPNTWLLPCDWNTLSDQFPKKKNRTYIVKPEASCQGKGIFLTKSLKSLKRDERYVVQTYISKPYLIDELKFDLRVYVLITNMNPLRAYIYKEGMARFATEKYKSPKWSNLKNLFMHLTNYAINKSHEDYEKGETDNSGNKKFMTYVLDYIKKETENQQVWERIKDLCIKTLIAVQPALAHSYKAARPQNSEESLWFQILGFDIMLDNKLKPWLLEVNHSPSFTTDSELDFMLKYHLIRDTITLLNLSIDQKQFYKKRKQQETQDRLFGKNSKISINSKYSRVKVDYDTPNDQNLGKYEYLEYASKYGMMVGRQHDSCATRT